MFSNGNVRHSSAMSKLSHTRWILEGVFFLQHLSPPFASRENSHTEQKKYKIQNLSKITCSSLKTPLFSKMDKFSKKHQTPSSEFFRIFINVWEYVRLLVEKDMKPNQKYFQAKFLGKMQSEIKRFKNGILSLREKNSSGGLSYQRDALNKECNQKKPQIQCLKHWK